MKNVKLYTEEQVINALKLAHSHITSLQNIIDRLTPIELPSDEEIFNETTKTFVNGSDQTGFMLGAAWMRDKLINQKK